MKMGFAGFMAEKSLGVTAACVMTECETFGMCYGCEPDCPVYERGECEIQEENKIFFEKDENSI
jgi:hypothetical protein